MTMHIAMGLALLLSKIQIAKLILHTIKCLHYTIFDEVCSSSKRSSGDTDTKHCAYAQCGVKRAYLSAERT